MSQQVGTTIAVIGIDIGKNSFHVVGLDHRGAIVMSALCQTQTFRLARRSLSPHPSAPDAP